MTQPSRRTPIALACAASGLAATAAYVAQRAIDYARGAAGDPTLVVLSYHVGYYWRIGTAVWWGVLVGLVVWAIARRRPDATTRVLVIVTPICAALAVVLSWMLP